jgi:hypothetical protein
MATAADFKGLAYVAHDITRHRLDLTEHQKVECVWALFPNAPGSLVVHELSLGQHHASCPTHHVSVEVLEAYQAWKPRGFSSDALSPSTPAPAPEPAINDLVAMAHALVDDPYWAANRGHRLTEHADRLRGALRLFEVEQEQASNEATHAEQSDAVAHASDPVTP